MLKLSINHSPRRPITLGAIVMLSVERRSADVEARVFLRQGPVLYPRPLADWSPLDEPVLIFPESPGPYAVDAHWRTPQGESGRTSLEFSVASPEQCAETGPTQVQLEHFSLWAPNAFEARTFEHSDRDVAALLERLVRPGDVVYDLGANVGFYAAHFARLAGDGGRVLCFEANPVCAYFLRSNLLALGLAQVTVLPTAILHVDGMTRFMINHGNTNLGLVETSGFFHYKPGQEIAVSCFTLDHLVTDLALPAPDVIKIDVEGAELQVLEGMAKTLAAHAPALLLELHGEACTQGAVRTLGELGYRFEDPSTGRTLDATAALATFTGDSVHQVIARPAA